MPERTISEELYCRLVQGLMHAIVLAGSTAELRDMLEAALVDLTLCNSTPPAKSRMQPPSWWPGDETEK